MHAFTSGIGGRSSEHAKTKPRFVESVLQNLEFSNLGKRYGWFLRAPRKSENAFVNYFSILIHRCGSHVLQHHRPHAREMPPDSGGILWGGSSFRRPSALWGCYRKSGITFVKHNSKLIHKRSFRFFERVGTSQTFRQDSRN